MITGQIAVTAVFGRGSLKVGAGPKDSSSGHAPYIAIRVLDVPEEIGTDLLEKYGQDETPPVIKLVFETKASFEVFMQSCYCVRDHFARLEPHPPQDTGYDT